MCGAVHGPVGGKVEGRPARRVAIVLIYEIQPFIHAAARPAPTLAANLRP